MTSRGNQIADAIAAYLTANRTQLPMLLNKIVAAPVTYYETEANAGPNLFAYPMEVTTQVDTRTSFRTDYKVGVTVTSLLVTTEPAEVESMQGLTEAIRNILKNVPQAGADFMQIGDETAVPEFDIEQESQGQYFVSSVEVDYLEMTQT